MKIWHDNFQTNCAAGGAPSVACEVLLISTMDVQAANNNTPGDEAPFISKSGNSGGAVHQPNSNGTVAARGIHIQGRNFASTCTLPSRFDSRCSRVTLYVPIRPVLDHFNVTIENN